MEAKNISAVVLAGGFGTRLSPLTDTVPKPLMKILCKSVLDITMEKLEKLGISDIAVSAHYRWQDVKRCVEKYKNARLVLEETPLGTAGGVKNCFEDPKNCVLVLSGDGIFDFDLAKIIDFHIREKADVTIVSKRCENPTSFGVILCDEKGRICELLEKPPWKKVVSDVVNTGIYLLSKKALAKIPDGISCDFSKDLFPKLINEGFDVRTVTADEYWCDIGSFDDYLKCNMDACRGLIKSVKPEESLADKLKKLGIDARDSVYMGENTVVGSNVVLDKGFVCGDGCKVEKDCTVSNSVFGNGVYIGKGSFVEGSILGDGVTVGENCIIEQGCVVAEGCVIKESTVLEKNTSVSGDGRMMSNLLVKDGGNMFVDDGTAMCSCFGEDVKKFAMSLCRALEAESERNVSIGLVCQNTKIKQSFIDGCSEKSRIFDCKSADASLGVFSGIFLPCDVTAVFEEMSDKVKIVLLTPSGEKISDSLERKISKYYGGITDEQAKNKQGESQVVCVDGTDEMYRLVLTQSIKSMLCGLPWLQFDISLDGENNARNRALSRALTSFCSDGENKFAKKIRASSDENGFILNDGKDSIDFNHSLCALYSANSPDIGLSTAYINESHPSAFEYEASKNGEVCQNAVTVKNALLEAKLLDYLVCRDSGFCLCAMLCLMTVSGKSISEIKSALSSFEIYTDIYYGENNRAHSMEKLCSLYGMGERRESGVAVKTSSGRVTVIPGRVKGFKIISEAASFEAAKELCERMGKAVVSENFTESENI